MRLQSTAIPLAALSILVAEAASAQWRCDCTAIVESCSAGVAIRGSFIEVTSDHQQCSRVDYFVDGLPFVAVVVDGVQRQDWIARNSEPRILVQGCQVCRENAETAAPAAPASPAPATLETTDAELTALIEVAPDYPAAARAQGIAGTVELSFTVGPFGNVEAATVTAARPPSVFDQAALAAISRWRYPADPERAPLTLTETLEFSLPDGTRQEPGAPGRAAAARPSAAARNQCLREQAVYNYGEMIEVGLMNACADPLLVYSCAAGTGQYAGRWVCANSEQARRVLTAPDDRRLGASVPVETQSGARDFQYAADFFIARAPNTQYWWLACGLTDTRCRDGALQWVRSVDRQLVGVDPQSRTSLALARSY